MRSSGESPRAPVPSGGHRRGEDRTGELLEPSLMARQSRASYGWMVVAGCRDAPLRSGRRGLVIVASPGEHRRPRGIEGALPGRVLCVRNVETPSGSSLRCGAGWWADREESRSPGRAKDGQEANAGGGNAAGNRDVQISALLLMVAEQPAGYGSSWPGRESGLTWSGEPARRNDEAIFRTDGQAGHRDGPGRRGERTRGRSLGWHQVDWRRAEREVRRLRQRIFTASRRGTSQGSAGCRG